MKTAPKRKSPPLPKDFFRSMKFPRGYEHYHYPSEQARRIFYHVSSIGEARPLAGWRMQHGKEAGYILHCLLAGKVWHRIGGKVHFAQANDCCLMDMTGGVEYGNDGPPAAQFFWVWFDGPAIPQVARELNADMEPVIRELNRTRVTTLFRQLIRATVRQPPGYEAQASALLSALLAELFVARAAGERTTGARPEPAGLSLPTRKAMALIARFYKYPSSIKQLAAKVGVSRYHFSRLFHRETGYTPLRYLNWYRIEQAKNLLRSTRKPIQQIAETVGISDAEHFSKLFRKLNGTSPRAYRKKHAGK